MRNTLDRFFLAQLAVIALAVLIVTGVEPGSGWIGITIGLAVAFGYIIGQEREAFYQKKEAGGTENDVR